MQRHMLPLKPHSAQTWGALTTTAAKLWYRGPLLSKNVLCFALGLALTLKKGRPIVRSIGVFVRALPTLRLLYRADVTARGSSDESNTYSLGIC